MKPLEAIRKYCVWCCGDDPRGVKDCPAKKCPLWSLRMRKGTGALRAIRTRCLDCSGGNARNVKNCWAKTCPLYAYRMGKNPARAGLGGSFTPRKPIKNQAPRAE